MSPTYKQYRFLPKKKIIKSPERKIDKKFGPIKKGKYTRNFYKSIIKKSIKENIQDIWTDRNKSELQTSRIAVKELKTEQDTAKGTQEKNGEF